MPHEQIEAIGFNGGSWNNERCVIFGGWPGVRILGVFKKDRKVDTKVLHQNFWVGPPLIIVILHICLIFYCEINSEYPITLMT